MSASTTTLTHHSSARRRRSLPAVALALCATVLLGGAGAGGVVWAHQRTQLDAARSDRAAAQATLDGALVRARADGLGAADLRPVTDAEAAVLAQGAVGGRLLVFDGGEVGHLHSQAAALRALVGRIDGLQAAATTATRQGVLAELDRLDQAVAAARAAGLDVDANGDAGYAAWTREVVLAASTPLTIAQATAHVEDHIGAVQQETQAKIAADAQAAAQAALAAAHDRAASILARADRLLAQAQQFSQLQVAQWATVIQAQHAAFAAATDVGGYSAVSAATLPAANGISSLLSMRSTAYADMATARQTVQDALTYHVDPGTVPAQLDAIQPQLDGAGTYATFQALDGQINAINGPLQDRVVIAMLGVGKVIYIRLANQDLHAYQDGHQVVYTFVTTGRPALPTPPGNYTVYNKISPFEMISDWPRSSPYWYPPSWVKYTLWFLSGGYAIHDAPWRSAYGPGTEANGSHGCVNVPLGAMTTLYGWADIGTRVVIR